MRWVKSVFLAALASLLVAGILRLEPIWFYIILVVCIIWITVSEIRAKQKIARRIREYEEDKRREIIQAQQKDIERRNAEEFQRIEREQRQKKADEDRQRQQREWHERNIRDMQMHEEQRQARQQDAAERIDNYRVNKDKAEKMSLKRTYCSANCSDCPREKNGLPCINDLH